jgi:glycosyltransferase involved in cell wall biosynthesis
MDTLLIIGQTFPEPSTTAAGIRMMQLISFFEEQKYHIVFSTTASTSEKSVSFMDSQIEVKTIKLNDESFNDFIKKLNPSIVLFDRFITEEKFGWRVAEYCPEAIRILDTEDLHFLRKARHEALKNEKTTIEDYLFSEAAIREIASIYRCDLSLIISEFEMNLLKTTFQINSDLLFYLPFLTTTIDSATFLNLPSFEARKHFVTIGNLLHAPNVDSVLFLKKEIWPGIRKQLPEAELHVYGAYAPQHINELHSEDDKFLVKGWADEVTEIMKSAKICLAPLRFGAGLKGKFIDAMKSGTPSITTAIGAEGLAGDFPFSGIVSETVEAIVQASVNLYTQKKEWLKFQENGFVIINKRFNKNKFSEEFKIHLNKLLNAKEKYRNHNFIGQILQYKNLQATKYMSKWIAEKNKSKEL